MNLADPMFVNTSFNAAEFIARTSNSSLVKSPNPIAAWRASMIKLQSWCQSISASIAIVSSASYPALSKYWRTTSTVPANSIPTGRSSTTSFESFNNSKA